MPLRKRYCEAVAQTAAFLSPSRGAKACAARAPAQMPVPQKTDPAFQANADEAGRKDMLA